jgi:hypothetical protein
VLYLIADQIVANGKRIVVKPPAGVQLFRNTAPDTVSPKLP